MRSPIKRQIGRWLRVYNRRRLLESMLAAAGFWAAIAGLLHIVRQVAVPSFSLGITAVILVGFTLVTAVYLRVRRRINRQRLALVVDRTYGLDDLMTTALALDRGVAGADGAMAGCVTAEALHRAGKVDMRTIGPFLWPRTALLLGGLGLSAAVIVGLVPRWTDSFWPPPAMAALEEEVPGEDTASAGQETAAGLSPENLEALTRDLEDISRMRERMAADSQAREALDRIGEQLGQAMNPAGTTSQQIGALSQAERRLMDLSRRGQDGSFLDEAALSEASNEELVESLRQALAEGDAQIAAELVTELARRTAVADAEGLRALGGAVLGSETASPQSTEGQDGSSMSREERQAAQQQLSNAGDSMQSEDRAGAMSELASLMSELARDSSNQQGPSQQALARTLEDVRSARQEQLAGLAGQGQNQNAQGAQSEGQQGSGRNSELARRLAEARARQESGQQQSSCQGGNGNDPAGQSCSSPQTGNSSGGNGQTPISEVNMMPGSWGTGGTTHGPGQGPTPAPYVGVLPPFDMPPVQWIESQWESGSEGMIEMIEGASHGERSNLTYNQILQNYTGMAEALARREDIPLTRRQYIQAYFEAIRQ